CPYTTLVRAGRLAGGAACRRHRQRLQAAVGGVSPSRRRGRGLPVGLLGRGAGPGTGRRRHALVAGAALGRHGRGDKVTTRTVPLPTAGGHIENYQLGSHPPLETETGPPQARRVYAAAHVVADPLGDPVGTAAIDWDATLAFRRHLWSLGFGVAEAM